MFIRSLFCATCGDRFLSCNGERICNKCVKKDKKVVSAELVQPVQRKPKKEEQTAFCVVKGVKGVKGAKAVCPQCGKGFVINEQLNKVYCSRACKENAKKDRNRQKRKLHR